MRALIERGPPCAIGRTTENGTVHGIFCRFGGWLRDGGAPDILTREYSTADAVCRLIEGGHVVGIERGKKPVLVPYIAGGMAEVFADADVFREHFQRFGVAFFLLWDGTRWMRSRPGLAEMFSAWSPVVGRQTKQRREKEQQREAGQ